MNMTQNAVLGIAAWLIAASAGAAETTVYRCVESGRVLYTDYPCRNAKKLEIDPGSADPAAARRLADAQAALDAGMARWRADEAREAARREALAEADAARAMAAPEPVQFADGYWPWYGAYVGPVRPRPHRAVPLRHDRPGMARPPSNNNKPPRPPRIEPRTR
jgi:hypothetical protein